MKGQEPQEINAVRWGQMLWKKRKVQIMNHANR